VKPLVLAYKGITPKIAQDAFIAPGAVIIGDVEIGSNSNVWFGCVIRGDVNIIRIGENTNIQDGTIVHVTRDTGPTNIGSGITIGHNALIHACTLEDNSFVGMAATIMDGVVIKSYAMAAAGALVTPGKTIPSGELWAGNPAKFMREMRQQDKEYIPWSAQHYVELSKDYDS